MALSLPSADEVRVIISTSLTDGQVDAIILDASLMVENCAEVAGYDADVQAAIVKYFAADIISVIKAQGGGVMTSDRLGDAARSYSVANLGKNANSFYRQQAYALDPSGCLRRLGGAQASFERV